MEHTEATANDRQISLGKDKAAAPHSPKTLPERYEAGRLGNLRLGFPVIERADALCSALTWLDKANPDELSEAADEIIQAHAARLAIKCAARVDAAMSTRIHHGFDAIPPDALVRELSAERDRAVDFYQQFRERKARIARLEALADKARVIAFPKRPRAPRAKLRKVETA